MDWNEIHRKLDRLQAEFSGAGLPSRSTNEELLTERARLLAMPVSEEAASADTIDLLLFQLSGEGYGIESEYVQEVQPLEELTPLPEVPSFVLGIVNIRGRILSVIDLRKLFDLPARGLTDQDRVIVISDGKVEFGILANDIIDIAQIREERVQEPVATITGIRRELIMGITPGQEVILNAARLLSDERLKVGRQKE